MKFVDLAANRHIPILLEMIRAITSAASPRETLELFVAAMRKAYGGRCYIHVSVADLPPGHFRVTRWLDRSGVEHVPPAAFDSVSIARVPIVSGGLVGELISTPGPKLLHELAIRDDAAFGDRLSGYGSLMAIPLLEQGRITSWVLLLEPDAHGISMDDLEDAIVQANLLALAIDHQLIAARLRIAQAEIDREVEQIAEIQRALLPTTLPNVPGLTIAASYRTFDRAGGDYYDVYPVGRSRAERVAAAADDRWAIMIADASGHGPSAAVVAAMVNAILHTFPTEPRGPSEVLEYLNRHLHDRGFGGAFVTAFLAFYDPADRSFTFANAGHNPPLLRPNGVGAAPVLLEEVGGLPLGIEERVDSGEHTIRLEPGQTIVLYTDGVVDERCIDQTAFGLERLSRLVERFDGTVGELVDHINEQLVAHQGPTLPEDDQTLVVVRMMPAR